MSWQAQFILALALMSVGPITLLSLLGDLYLSITEGVIFAVTVIGMLWMARLALMGQKDAEEFFP